MPGLASRTAAAATPVAVSSSTTHTQHASAIPVIARGHVQQHDDDVLVTQPIPAPTPAPIHLPLTYSLPLSSGLNLSGQRHPFAAEARVVEQHGSLNGLHGHGWNDASARDWRRQGWLEKRQGASSGPVAEGCESHRAVSFALTIHQLRGFRSGRRN